MYCHMDRLSGPPQPDSIVPVWARPCLGGKLARFYMIFGVTKNQSKNGLVQDPSNVDKASPKSAQGCPLVPFLNRFWLPLGSIFGTCS